jgi:hypothetical protein
MFRGKTTCKVLKEVRRKIADANGIPLQERECTHTGDCAGTCPYCESEVRYLERELSKRKSLGKAVAVAGIALSAVSMAGCATSEAVSKTSDNNPPKTPGRQITDALSWMGAVTVEDGGKPKVKNPEKHKSKNGKQSQKCDTIQVRGIVQEERPTEEESVEFTLPNDTLADVHEVVVGMVDDDLSLFNRQPVEEFVPKSIEGYEEATFPEEFGTPASWLRSKLTEFTTYIQQPRMEEVEIRFFVEVDGRVSSVVFMHMPEPSNETDEAFRNAVREALLSMPRWHRASVWGKPVSALITLKVRDLR